jgi:hypothetical protein
MQSGLSPFAGKKLMEAVYALLFNWYGTRPFFRSAQPGTLHPDTIWHCVSILSQSLLLATNALVDTGCLYLSSQTRANLLGMISCLLEDLKPFAAADMLRANLLGLRPQLKELSTPVMMTRHAYLYGTLSTINERTSAMMLGGGPSFDELSCLLSCATDSLSGEGALEMTPTLRIIIQGLIANLRQYPGLPPSLGKVIASLKKCLRRKRIKLLCCY